MAVITSAISFIWTGTNATIPSGWARTTDLDGYYPRIINTGDTVGATGGNSTHSHSSSSHSHSINAHTHTFTLPAGANYGTGDGNGGGGSQPGIRREHTHGTTTSGAVANDSTSSVAVTYSSVSNDPPYFEVIFIHPTSDANGLPNGVVSLVDGTSLGSLTLCDGNNSTPNLIDKFLKGAAASGDAGGTGGSTTNTHTIDHTHTNTHSHAAATTAGGNSQIGVNTGGSLARNGHTHSVALNTCSTITSNNNSDIGSQSETVQPPYKGFVAGQNRTGSNLMQLNIVGIYMGAEGSAPSGWTVLAKSAALIKCVSTANAGTTGGSETHTHGSQSHTHTNPAHTHATPSVGHGADVRDSSGSTAYADTGTTHASTTSSSVQADLGSGSTTADSANNMPPFRNVLLLRLDEIATDTNSERAAKTSGKDSSNSERDAKLTGTAEMIADIKENFNTNDYNHSNWDSYDAGSMLVFEDQVFKVVHTLAAGDWAGLVTLRTYNLTGGFASVKFAQIPNSSSSALMYMKVSLDDGDQGNNYQAMVEAGTLYFQVTTAWSQSTIGSVAYSNNTKYVRIREASGYIYFETSPDGNEANFTTQCSVAVSHAVSSLLVELGGGQYTTETSPGVSIFDNFNCFELSNERAATLTGEDYANSERDAKLTGKDTSSSERDAKIHGQETSQDTRDAKIHGKAIADDERDAKLTGKDSSASERSAKLTGFMPEYSERDAKIVGKDTSDSERSAKLTGYLTDSSERSAKIKGGTGSSSERSAKITGTGNEVQDERWAKLSGIDTTQSERAAKIHGKDTDNSERDAKITGKITTQSERSAKIKGSITLSSERAAKITGGEGASSERSAKLTGVFTAQSERSAKISGFDTASSERSAKLEGCVHETSERWAKIKGTTAYANEFQEQDTTYCDSKFDEQGTVYTDKHAKKNSIYTDKFNKKNSTYTDKFTKKGTEYRQNQ